MVKYGRFGRARLAVITLALAAWATAGAGCGNPCVEIDLLKASAAKPANVRLMFKVSTCDGEPVSGLEQESFLLREDYQEISGYESRHKILPRPQGFRLSTLLLLDVSGSMLQSGGLKALQDAARALVAGVPADQEVAVFLFDGRKSLIKLLDFTGDKEALKTGLESLSSYKQVDPSTNLYGAIVKGLQLLDARKDEASTDLITAASMVVFTDGTDQAGRVGALQAGVAVDSSKHSVFTIGLGGEINRRELEAFGKDGFEFARDAKAIEAAFKKVAGKIEGASKSYYVLQYCTPKRSGRHQVALEIRNRSGAAYYTFQANDFGPGCSTD